MAEQGQQATSRFRSKPQWVEAFQWKPGVQHEALGVDDKGTYVTTIHGERAHIATGDWCVQEPDGVHYYPCKPDIFAKVYEPAVDAGVSDVAGAPFNDPGLPAAIARIEHMATIGAITGNPDAPAARLVLDALAALRGPGTREDELKALAQFSILFAVYPTATGLSHMAGLAVREILGNRQAKVAK